MKTFEEVINDIMKLCEQVPPVHGQGNPGQQPQQGQQPTQPQQGQVQQPTQPQQGQQKELSADDVIKYALQVKPEQLQQLGIDLNQPGDQIVAKLTQQIMQQMQQGA